MGEVARGAREEVGSLSLRPEGPAFRCYDRVWLAVRRRPAIRVRRDQALRNLRVGARRLDAMHGKLPVLSYRGAAAAFRIED